MRKIISAAALAFALQPLAQAQTVGDAVGEAGKEVKKAAKATHDVVWTRCADGRKTVKGKSGCDGHGGVAHPRPAPKPAPAPK